jgi:hypothetical protein
MSRRHDARIGERLIASIAAFCVAALLLAGPTQAGGGSSGSLGPAPPPCTVNYYPGSDCLVQTRLGAFHLSTSVARPGQTVTGTIASGCEIGYGNTTPCPVNWNLGLRQLGKVVSGCKTDDYTCTVRIPEEAPGTKGYSVVFIGITNAQGTGYGSDYLAVIGKGPAVIEGRIVDKQGAALAGVGVTLHGEGGDYAAQTAADGSYAVEVKPGSYHVTPRLASAKPAGFAPASADRSVQAGGTAHADFSAQLPALAIADVSGADVPFAADVRVEFDDAATDAAGCDPNATYSFTDPALASATSLGDCRYRLTFAQPGSGIYRVALTATTQAGEQVPVTTDQDGNTVDGHFPVIIDSCARPAQQIPAVISLVNAQDASCDVSVGSWDGDAPTIAQQVQTDAANEPGLPLEPVPVTKVDPSDWSKRDIVVMEAPGTGWLPTGDAEPSGELPTGNGDAVAVVHKVQPPGVPEVWNGAGTKLSEAQLQAAAPATEISAHGAWYTPNGLIRVPAGDQITTFVPIGAEMDEALGLHVDTGHIVGLDRKYMHTYTPGELMPNFTFVHLGDAGEPQGAHVVAVPSPTTLEAMIRPDEGAVWIGACADVFVPPGEDLAQGLRDLPIHVPGTGTVSGSTSATIDAQGTLHTG